MKLPGGGTIPLVHITDWDIRWQNVYVFREPVEVPKGSKIEVLFRFDNSLSNPNNPNLPPERVRWGWGSAEEMAEIYLTYIAKNESMRKKLLAASRLTWLRSAEPDARKRKIDVQTALGRLQQLSLWEDEGEALLNLLARTNKLEALTKAARKAAGKKRQDADAQALHGGLLAIQLQYATSQFKQYRLWSKANAALGRALKLAPEHWTARITLAVMNTYSGDGTLLNKGRKELVSLLDFQEQKRDSPPRFARTYLHLGSAHELSGNKDKARQVWKRGLDRFPRNYQLKNKLKGVAK